MIASCLLYFVVRDIALITNAHAQSGGVVDVNIVKIDGLLLRHSSAAIPVKVVK